jgi:dGTP triphosphohydrolase
VENREYIMKTQEIIENLGKIFIKDVRDYTIRQIIQIVEGEARAPSSRKLHDYIKHLNEDDKKSIKRIAIDSIDTAISNFFWFIEQNEEIIDLVVMSEEDGKSYKLRDISDGMCGDYASFIDDYSAYKLSDEEEFTDKK